jgi:YidC/Oxa1 family membrane protein insertase
VLNFIYYPVSFILWVWHKAFGFLLGPDNGIAWALSVMFLVFTLRAILYKPFVHQVRSMRRMQEFQPEIAKLRKKYANDRQKQAEEMQRLQKEHGVNPLGGCLPVLVQVPVFIGLFHVLREFGPLTKDGLPRTENYFFGLEEVQSFNRSDLFGAKLGNWVLQGEEFLNAAGTSVASMLIVMIPLMIAAGIFTHITARHSVARQTAAQAENPQTAIMNRLMLYVFPIGVVVGAPFLPLAVLLYWVSNNLWTLGQQYVVYKRIDAEESAKREQAAVTRQARAPRPGQKPVRPETTGADDKPAKRPGAKPVMRKQSAGGETAPEADAAVNGSANSTASSTANGTANSSAGTNSSAADEANAGSGATNGASGGKGATPRSARSGGGTRPSARRPRKRR